MTAVQRPAEFQHLIGERIADVYLDGRTLVLVFESGGVLRLNREGMQLPAGKPS